MANHNGSTRSLNVNVKHCKFKDAIFGVQELIANAVDADRYTGKTPKVEYSGNVLTIADSGRGLVNSDFILGESGGELDTIGSFGAGLLDAVAVLKKDGCVLTSEGGVVQVCLHIPDWECWRDPLEGGNRRIMQAGHQVDHSGQLQARRSAGRDSELPDLQPHEALHPL
eukprot:TRINITY_DN149_c0_g1_i9.p1 TRINITY_DN149_c0_g1~~TRINITY_DN149_c0_g1_i9.p1  ORF type:complete len:169 (+),score=6.71 TRINITY_DN149_c0_g1_i9:45-551(+)